MYSEKVIIVSAPSGSGKTTLVRYCLKEIPQLQFSISATTRLPRGAEKEGVDYYFLSIEAFKEKIAEDAFVEFQEVYKDKFYGTLKSEVEQIWKAGKAVIFDVDVKGGVNLKRIFGEKALSVFIAPPSVEELRRRLVKRATDDKKTIEIRVAKFNEELSYSKDFDEIIVNDEIEKAKNDIKNLVNDFIKKV